MQTMDTIFRRRFIKLGILTAAASIVPGMARAATKQIERRLAFHSTHTEEYLDVVYRIGDEYIPESLARINGVLRDHRDNQAYPMDTNLLDLLYGLSVTLRNDAAFHVISGFRSSATNAVLAAQSEGVATQSLHTKGKAIDIRLPGLALGDLHRAAVSLKLGGVGYYPRSDFVHVDVGRVRYW
jgi:uncharacterized protein YcbK (DUF882 family)